MEMVVVVTSSKSLCAIAIFFASIEYVDEMHSAGVVCGSEGMVPTGPPVWRSQLMNSHLLLSHVNKQLSGEKLSNCVPPWRDFKVLSRLSVTASRISTVVAPTRATAIYREHGDHAAVKTEAG